MLSNGFINAFVSLFWSYCVLFALFLNFLCSVPVSLCHFAQECYQDFSGNFLLKLICSKLSAAEDQLYVSSETWSRVSMSLTGSLLIKLFGQDTDDSSGACFQNGNVVRSIIIQVMGFS